MRKVLGIDIVPLLSPKYHIKRTVKDTNCVLTSIKKVFKPIDKEIFSKLFKTSIRPELEYASYVWLPH